MQTLIRPRWEVRDILEGRVRSSQVEVGGSLLERLGGHSQVGWHLIEADTPVALHVLPAVDL